MKRIACTIVSANYLHFAWTLAESFLKVHPDDEFHLLLVDKLPQNFVSRDHRVQVHEVEKLGLPEFKSLAFKYDILELNTAVKPSFLKHLLGLGADQVVYFDPDIYIFQPITPVYEALAGASIVLTPHILSPTADAEHVYERDFLNTGVFNLGFIAVGNTAQGRAFLEWWEERCLSFCFEDLRSGLFVDQKWMNLVPCLFSETTTLRHSGLNVAYWNLAERLLTRQGGRVMVNGTTPLVFFHFSGYSPERPGELSRKLRLPYSPGPLLCALLAEYGAILTASGSETYKHYSYAFKHFSNGKLISHLARRNYSLHLERWPVEDPFNSAGVYYRTAHRAGLLSDSDQSGRFSTNNLPEQDRRLRAINRVLFALPRLIGSDRYTMLMKYLSYITILRNQRGLLGSPAR